MQKAFTPAESVARTPNGAGRRAAVAVAAAPVRVRIVIVGVELEAALLGGLLEA